VVLKLANISPLALEDKKSDISQIASSSQAIVGINKTMQPEQLSPPPPHDHQQLAVLPSTPIEPDGCWYALVHAAPQHADLSPILALVHAAPQHADLSPILEKGKHFLTIYFWVHFI